MLEKWSAKCLTEYWAESEMNTKLCSKNGYQGPKLYIYIYPKLIKVEHN